MQRIQTKRSLLEDLDLIQEQSPQSFLALKPSTSNAHNETAVQEQAHKGTICLMESHSSALTNGSQTVQLGFVLTCLVLMLVVRCINSLRNLVNGLLTEMLGPSPCTTA
jgi:hypothetical protein